MTFTFPPSVANSAAMVALLTFAGLVLRLIGPWRKQISDLEERIRQTLLQDKLRCEAELRVVKHRERNSRTMVYALMRVIDMEPAERAVMLEHIRQDLDRIEQSEAVESATVSMGGITDHLSGMV